MKTKSLILQSILMMTFSAAHSAQAADGFSLSKWKEAFSEAVRKKQTSQLASLSRLNTIESKAVPNCVQCSTKLKMRQARELFDQNQLDAASRLYYQIPKGSDLWLEAVEERAWVHFRKDEYEKAIAQTKTLLSPQFVGAVGSEAYFLQSLSKLRICDYSGVLETHQLFKQRQRQRIVDMTTLAQTGTNSALQALLKKDLQFPLQFEEIGDAVTQLPLLFYRDKKIQINLVRLKVAQAALAILPETSFQELNSQLSASYWLKIQKESSKALFERLKYLAKDELESHSKMIKKLNLIEVEVIQRIHTDQKLSQKDFKESDFRNVSDDELIFMDDGQPWIDELDKYDVVAKSCQKGIRRKM